MQSQSLVLLLVLLLGVSGHDPLAERLPTIERRRLASSVWADVDTGTEAGFCHEGSNKLTNCHVCNSLETYSPHLTVCNFPLTGPDASGVEITTINCCSGCSKSCPLPPGHEWMPVDGLPQFEMGLPPDMDWYTRWNGVLIADSKLFRSDDPTGHPCDKSDLRAIDFELGANTGWTNSGSYYNFQCSPGYTPGQVTVYGWVSLSGVPAASCLDGKWQNIDQLRCGGRDACKKSDLSKIPFESGVNSGWLESHASYEFKCGKGFSPANGPAECLNGLWSNLDDLRCDPIPCAEINLQHGDAIADLVSSNLIEEDSRAFVRVFDVICDTGYTASVRVARCVLGDWLDTPTCDENDCPGIVLSYGNDIPEAAHGSSVSVTCDNGYTGRVGAGARPVDRMSCYLGQWTTGPNMDPVSPLCDENRCDPMYLQNGDDLKSADHGTSVSVRCDTGFSPSVDTVSCIRGELSTYPTWSVYPTCDESDCPAIVLSYGNDIAQAAHGSSVSVTCEGARSGPDTISCYRGEWSPIPTCYPRFDCDAIVLPYGNDIPEAVHGSSVSVTCDGSASVDTISCYQGEWSEIPTCYLFEEEKVDKTFEASGDESGD